MNIQNKYKMLLLLLISLNAFAENESYTQWVANGKPELNYVPVAPTQPSGALATFGDLASFQAATPGAVLNFEDFEGGATGLGVINFCTPPVDSNSNDPCFSPGDLIGGFNLNVSTPGNGLVALGDGFIFQPTVVVGANTFTDSTILNFTNTDVEAVAMEITDNVGGTVTLTVSGNSGVLGTVPVNITGVGAMTFVGIIAAEPITSIAIEQDGGNGEVIDNLYFGSLVPPVPLVIPTLSGFGLVLLGLALFFFVRKRVQV